MGVDDPITVPEYWNCAWAKQPIPFGFNLPKGYHWAFDHVIDVDGKAAFTNDIAENIATYGPPCRFFYTPTGTYAGVNHVVTSIGTDGTIYTTTDFIADDNRTNSYCLVNLTYRMYYGLPDPSASTTYIDIKPFWKADGTMIVNLSEYLRSIFTVPVPVPVLGDDQNLYNYFCVDIIGSQDFADWCTLFSVDMVAEIFSFSASYDMAEHIRAVNRGCMDHATWYNTYCDPGLNPIGETPVVFTGRVLVYSVYDPDINGIKNIISLP